MKLFKQTICAVLTLCLCTGLLLVPSAPVFAADSPNAPKAVDVFYYKNFPLVNDSAIPVQLGTSGKNIKNVKTSDKNLKAKVTRLSVSTSQNSGYIGVYAKKTGKYKVSFDVYNAKNKKIKTLSVKVNVIEPDASNASPFKSVTFDNKEYNFENTVYSKNSVKINVKMNNGYKLKRIEYKAYSKPASRSTSSNSINYSNSEVTKTVTNGKSIKLGHYASYHGYDFSYSSGTYSSESYSRSTGIMAPTTVIITYLDKNKNTISTSYTLYRIADDVK